MKSTPFGRMWTIFFALARLFSVWASDRRKVALRAQSISLSVSRTRAKESRRLASPTNKLSGGRVSGSLPLVPG